MKVPAVLSPAALVELKALADKATPGPWRECRDEVLIGDEWARLCRPEDAAYVAAASPEVVIALINSVGACLFVIEALSPPLPSAAAPPPLAQRELLIAEELREIRNDLRPISPCLADRVEAVARKLAGGP